MRDDRVVIVIAPDRAPGFWMAEVIDAESLRRRDAVVMFRLGDGEQFMARYRACEWAMKHQLEIVGREEGAALIREAMAAQ